MDLPPNAFSGGYLGASLVGGPVSTTQVVSSTIMGVGAAERVNKVRWTVPLRSRCLAADQNGIHD